MFLKYRFFCLQGFRAEKEIPTKFFSEIAFVHNRIDKELEILQRFLNQILCKDLSLEEFYVKLKDWRKLKDFQVQCCYLQGKKTWSQFCLEFLEVEPEVSIETINPIVRGLPPLDASERANGGRGWWVNYEMGIPHPSIKAFLDSEEARHRLKAEGQTTDEVFFCFPLPIFPCKFITMLFTSHLQSCRRCTRVLCHWFSPSFSFILKILPIPGTRAS